MNRNLKKLLKYCLGQEKKITIQGTATALQLSESTVGTHLRYLLTQGVVKVTQVKPVHYQLVSTQERLNGASYCLSVYKSTALAGYVFIANDAYCFFYNLNYLIHSEAQAISPLFPLKIEIFHSDILFPAFSQLLPEGEDRAFLEAKAGTANELCLLAALSNNYGDLSFNAQKIESNEIIKLTEKQKHKEIYIKNKPDILGQHSFPNKLEFDIDIKKTVLFPTDTLLASKQYKPSGLSGFQHKLAVTIDFDSKKIIQYDKGDSSIYFIKPYNLYKADINSKYYLPHLAINEHLFMSFAKNELGFDVPWSALVKRPEDVEYHYVVKRYDRDGVHKFAHTEFAPLLGLTAETKYDISTEKMCRTIKTYLPKVSERLILLNYLFYSVLIVHEDMHTKNLSLVLEGGINCMAPLYDVACTGIYQNLSGHETGLKLGGQYTKIRPPLFYQLAEILDIKKKQFQDSAHFILEQYTQVLPTYLEKLALFSEATITRKTQPIAGKPQRLVNTETIQEELTQFHQKRIESLEKLGWYKAF